MLLNSLTQPPPPVIKPLSTWLILASVALWLTLCIGVLAVVVVLDIRNVKDELTQYGDAYSDHLNRELVGNETILKGFSALFDAVGDTSPDEITRYVGQVIESNPQIFSLEIIQRVPDGRLAEFVAGRRHDGIPNFAVKSFSYESDRKWQPVEKKAFYYPIVFMAPMQTGFEDVLGLDIDSVSILRQALSESLRQRRPVASHPLRLVEGNLAYVVFSPILRTLQPSDPVSAQSGQDEMLVDMVVDAVKLARPIKLPVFEGGSVRVHHRDFQPDDPKGQLLAMSGKARSAMETSLFPTFTYEKSLMTLGEPFALQIRRQMGWCDLSLGLLALMAVLTLLSTMLLIAYLRKYRQDQHLQLEHQQLLWQHANHDALTGLPNRMLLMDRMRQILARMQRQKKRMACIFLDLDDFKQINDSYGHASGDQLLTLVAERLRAAVRTEDTVARLSGDEFIILIESVETPDALETVCQKIRQRLAEGFQLQDQRLVVQTSIGVATFPEDGDSPEALLKEADIRMYANKQVRMGRAP